MFGIRVVAVLLLLMQALAYPQVVKHRISIVIKRIPQDVATVPSDADEPMNQGASPQLDDDTFTAARGPLQTETDPDDTQDSDGPALIDNIPPPSAYAAEPKTGTPLASGYPGITDLALPGKASSTAEAQMQSGPAPEQEEEDSNPIAEPDMPMPMITQAARSLDDAEPYLPVQHGQRTTDTEPVPLEIGGTERNEAATATAKMNLPEATGAWEPSPTMDMDMDMPTLTISIGPNGKLPSGIPPEIAAAISSALGLGQTAFPYFPENGPADFTSLSSALHPSTTDHAVAAAQDLPYVDLNNVEPAAEQPFRLLGEFLRFFGFM